MEGTGIIAAIAGVVSLILYLLKRRDTPKKKQERILRALEERIAKTRKVVASGDADAINRHAADLRDDVLSETLDNPLNKGSGDETHDNK